ncbi:MAG: glycoside hydrolase, partial [Massilibacteroides sp.]|nr:glycoside hydrolase [Massilibacteroides sp.]
MKKFFCFLLLFCAFFSFPLNAESWKGCWINTEQCQSSTNTWLVYRKAVHLEVVPAALTAKIAADTKYWLWINDQLVVFEGGLKR